MIFIKHSQLGEIALSNSPRAKRISLSVKANGEIRLTVPQGVRKNDALNFLEAKKDWVVKAKAKIEKRNPVRLIEMPYSTRRHRLTLDPANTDNIRIGVAKNIINITYPAVIRFDEPQIQEAIKKGIEEAWRIEAKSYLPQRTQELCGQLGFKCKRVTVRNAKTRWGSCSPDDNISLSLHLMKLPDHLIDYIIIHELCHTVHKNHGPKFHQLLDKKTNGRHEAMRRELKQYTARY